jgi:hypothetical protein
MIASRAHPHLSSLHVLTRAQRTRVHFCPQHRLLCHLGLYLLEFELQNEYIYPRLARSEPRTGGAAVAVAPPSEERQRAPGNLQKPIPMFVIIQLPPTKRRRSMCQKSWTRAGTLRHSLTTRRREITFFFFFLGSRAKVLRAAQARQAGAEQSVECDCMWSTRHFFLRNNTKKRHVFLSP